jgi:hypothetical protein
MNRWRAEVSAEVKGVSREELWARRKHALEYAHDQHLHGSPIWAGLCQKAVRIALGAGPGAASARLAWLDLPDEDRHGVGGKHPPAGVPAYFRLDTPYWHVALSAGKGLIWSTDILRRGHWDKVSIPYLERRWHAHYLGWAESINGRRVWPRAA